MSTQLLWIDDEVDSLKSQILFLEQKGYQVATVSNGYDGLEYIKNNIVDVVLLDESMPGITGLQTLQQIKEIKQNIPVVLITKNEAENIMDEAIGSQISDYLIKPVNPNQVLLSLKKLLDNKRLVAEKTTSAYQQEFRNLFMALNSNPNQIEWMELYKKLTFWELEMSKSDSPEMQEIFESQKSEANSEFFKFISRNYISWIANEGAPTMSHTLLKNKVFPFIEKDKPLFFILIDNLRFDQWRMLQPIFEETFRIVEEDTFYGILPTATQYARNAIFSGLLPIDIAKKFPDDWLNDDEEGGKNMSEELYFNYNLQQNKLGHLKRSYTKIVNHADAEKLANNMHNFLQNDINVIVYNFVDMLSHARTEMEVLKELASDEVSYRSLTKSWFEHSPLLQALKKLTGKNATVIVGTDHGSLRVKHPIKIIGDKLTTANLRYKHGKNLNYEAKDVLAFKDPKLAGLPSPNVNSSFVFAKEDTYLCYPNNYNHFVNYYKNTFQHGGVSLEEMVIPIIRMITK